MYCRNRPNVISNDLKCVGGAYDAPPDPLIVSGFAPKALAPRPLRRLKAEPPSFLGTNLTLHGSHAGATTLYIYSTSRCSSYNPHFLFRMQSVTVSSFCAPGSHQLVFVILHILY